MKRIAADGSGTEEPFSTVRLLTVLNWTVSPPAKSQITPEPFEFAFTGEIDNGLIEFTSTIGLGIVKMDEKAGLLKFVSSTRKIAF